MERFPFSLDVLANRQALSWFLVPVLFLPVGTTILFLFGQLFGLLGDALSASVLAWTALALCVLWCLALVLLLLCTVFILLSERREEEDVEM